MRKNAALTVWLLSISFLLVGSQRCFGQANKIITPLTAEDLRQLCKSYEYVVLSVELDKKNMSSTDIAMAASCLNFIVGVSSTVAAMDVGYYPELKLALADSEKSTAFPKLVKIVVTYIDATPDAKKESAAGIVIAALLKAGILVPKHWTDK